MKPELDYNGPDFEDNSQIASARNADAAFIITCGASGFPQSEVPVLTPSDFLARGQ